MKRKNYVFGRPGWLFALVSLAVWSPHVHANENATDTTFQILRTTFDQLMDEGLVVGAQVVAGHSGQIPLEHHVGWLSPDKRVRVDANTMFGIGSDSKPMATAIIMTLVAEGRLQLDDPVSRWIPELATPSLTGGGSADRSPTVREIMTHYAGFYSQKKKLTRPQIRLIRDFSQTLSEAVDGIVQEPLLAPPGQAYAYSGAGYCVLGRVAELATDSAFESLLQSQLCAPLRLNRTTFFPRADDNLAVGARRVNGQWTADPQAPHLTKPENRFALVGGSIYSTASDQARFAQMVLAQGASGRRQFLSPELWQVWVERQNTRAKYGLGWGQTFAPNGENNLPIRLTHNGALGGYRASIAVNLETGFYAAANWTLHGLGHDQQIRKRVQAAFKQAEQSVAN